MKTNLWMLLALLSLAACGVGVDSTGNIADDSNADDAAFTSDELRRGSEDKAATVDVGSWNVEWFGATDQGPTDELLQQANVLKVLKRVDLDLVGLVEVVDENAFHTLLAGLPNHDGILVTDPRVQNGARFYSANEQKVALLFKKRFTLESARVVVTGASWDFGGRPPMEVTLSFQERGTPRSLTVLVAHFKAMANADGYARRTRASAALKTYLDSTTATQMTLVVGDLNDDIDRSTYRGNTSPFSNFTSDSAHYRFTTDALTVSNQATTSAFPSTIDHHLASAALYAHFVEGSAKVIHPETTVKNYSTSTSDHFPVLTRYNLR